MQQGVGVNVDGPVVSVLFSEFKDLELLVI